MGAPRVASPVARPVARLVAALIAVIALIVPIVLGAPPAARAGDTVRIDTGVLKGVTADGVTSFKGIPFAAPPVGPLRWRPPMPPAAWTGVRDASRQGEICMQVLSKDNGVGPGPASEDCLTLNIFRPAARGARRLAVMVWIHGGGLVNGSATAALYDGRALARQGVILVTINYRLGRFGFFAHPALTAEAAGRADIANYGLMDQVAALKWVGRNIAAFGGDPANVTIFGESSGGMSVNRLMMIKAARGLFRRAIVESGLGRERGQTLAEAEAAGAAVAAKLGVTANDAAALRAIPAGALLAAGDPDIFAGEAPILDGRMLSEDADRAFAAGHMAKVPYLAGSNSLEFPSFWLSPRLKALVRLTPEETAAAVAGYGSRQAYDDHVGADVLFGEPARALARDVARLGAPVWLYRFSVVSASAPKDFKGAVHASDRQYVFQTLNASPWPTDARDAALARTISAYWVAFARTGDPNGRGRPRWPRYDRRDLLLNFTNDGPVAMATPDGAALDAIAKSHLDGR
jgi:para-nitrobenzyl esterase